MLEEKLLQFLGLKSKYSYKPTYKLNAILLMPPSSYYWTITFRSIF